MSKAMANVRLRVLVIVIRLTTSSSRIPAAPMVKLFGSFILLDNDKRNHYFSVVKTFILTPDRRDNTSSLHGRENPAHLNATFIRQASHEIQGSFFGVSSLCVLLKDAIGNQGDAGVLLDHLAEA